MSTGIAGCGVMFRIGTYGMKLSLDHRPPSGFSIPPIVTTLSIFAE